MVDSWVRQKCSKSHCPPSVTLTKNVVFDGNCIKKNGKANDRSYYELKMKIPSGWLGTPVKCVESKLQK